MATTSLEQLVTEAEQKRPAVSSYASAAPAVAGSDQAQTITPVASPTIPNNTAPVVPGAGGAGVAVAATPVTVRPAVDVAVEGDDNSQSESEDVIAKVAGKLRRKRRSSQPDLAARPAPAPAPEQIATQTILHGKHSAVSLLIAAVFGLALVGVAWTFGASTTVDFIYLMFGWSLPVSLPMGSLQITINLMWLFPIGLTFFQLAYRPPVSLRGAVRHFQRDPAISFLWLILTAIAVGTTLGGLIEWASRRHWLVEPRPNPAQFVIWYGCLLSAIAVEYLAEPLALKFWYELKSAGRYLLASWDAETKQKRG